jgi:hypothetical protein
LAAGCFRLGGLLDRVSARFVAPAEFADMDPKFDTLRNVNTTDDYARVLAELALPPDGGSR